MTGSATSLPRLAETFPTLSAPQIARMRVDRLMEFSWKYLLPWSVFNILAAGFAILVKR